MFNVSGPNHCGMENFLHGGQIPVKYKICLQATGALDEKGFLIDNMFISNFMEAAAHRGTTLSCELLLEELANQLASEMKQAEPSLHVLAFTVELSPDFGPDNEATMKFFYETETPILPQVVSSYGHHHVHVKECNNCSTVGCRGCGGGPGR